MIRRFRPYFRYVTPHRGTLIAAILCGLVYSAASTIGLPLMVKYVIPRVFADNAVALTTWQIIAIAMWLPFVFTVRGVAGYFNTYLIQKVGTRVLEGIRIDFFRKLQVLSLSALQRHNSGDLMSRGLADANLLQMTLTNSANEIIKSPAALVGSICFVTWLAFREEGVGLVLASLAVVPLCVFPIRFVGRKLIKRASHIQTELGAVNERFAENLAAAREVRAFGLEEYEAEKFGRVSKALIRAQLKFAKYEKALSPAIEIISTFGIGLTFVYAYQVRLHESTFLALLTAIYASYEPIKKLGALSNEFRRGSGALDRLEEVLNAPVDITDPIDPVRVDTLSGTLRFERVNFAYKAGEPVLRDVTVEVPAGTTCALVGPSGSGKTTFANLVPRFFEVQSGAVTIDGTDIRRMKLADLRGNIALVSQESVLFNDTIYNNILLGRPDATRQEVHEAAQNAFAHDFILAQPDGYDTIVGERGGKLSGGQRQRLSLARAFLRNAPILILDEATSALDGDSEAAIQLALKRLVVGKTVLIIAHRFSTIRDASMILVFDRGTLSASGGHAELYESNVLYRSLYDHQTATGELH